MSTITDHKQLQSLIEGIKKHTIAPAEEEIVKQRRIINNYEALIKVIQETGQYENSNSNTSARAKAWWIKTIGKEYKPF